MYSTATHIFLYLKEVIIIIVSLLNNDNVLCRQIDLDKIPHLKFSRKVIDQSAKHCNSINHVLGLFRLVSTFKISVHDFIWLNL